MYRRWWCCKTTWLFRSEKLLASRAALAGERKQVTVLFADLKDSTEFMRGYCRQA